MDFLVDFIHIIETIISNVLSYFIYKWLDR